MNAPARQRVVMEREHGLEGHPVVGAQFVEGIGLPATIESSIRHHHDPEPPQDAHGRVGWLAEIVAAVFEGGATAVELARASRAGELLGLDAGTIEALLDELPERIRAESGSFGRDLGPVPDLADLTRNANQTLVEMNLHYEDLVRRLEAVIAEKDAIARELERANAKLSDLATTDELTRMPNKRALTTMIDQSLAQLDRRRGVISLIVIDVDHFKRFNDTWGHAVGDEVLRVVGKVLMAGVRAGDLAGRYGGEEFVVVLPNTDPEGASVVGERLRASLERTAVAGPEGDLHVTASFGIASVRGPGCKDAAKELFERADAALYDAKRTGRNRVALAA